MSALFPDTRPEAEAVLVRMLRVAPSWRKLEMVDQLNQVGPPGTGKTPLTKVPLFQIAG